MILLTCYSGSYESTDFYPKVAFFCMNRDIWPFWREVSNGWGLRLVLVVICGRFMIVWKYADGFSVFYSVDAKMLSMAYLNLVDLKSLDGDLL